MPIIPANNSVALSPDGYIEVNLVGDQSYIAIDEVRRAALPIVKDLQVHNSKVLGLIDVSKMTASSTGSRKAGLETLEALDYDKCAFVGAQGMIIEFISLLLAALGKSHNTQMFSDRNAALVWLLGEPK